MGNVEEKTIIITEIAFNMFFRDSFVLNYLKENNMIAKEKLENAEECYKKLSNTNQQQ